MARCREKRPGSRSTVANHLNLVEETFREQRTDGTVDQTGDEGLTLARTAFTTEETTRDTTGSIGTLLIVDGQREKSRPFFGLFLTNDSHEYHRYRPC